MKRRDFLKLSAATVAAPTLLAARSRVAAAEPARNCDTVTAEILCRDEYVNIGSYQNLRVGDVFRARWSDGTIQCRQGSSGHELCVVMAPPVWERCADGMQSSVMVEHWDDFVAPLKTVDWPTVAPGVEQVFIGAGAARLERISARGGGVRIFLLSREFDWRTRAYDLWHMNQRAAHTVASTLAAAFPQLPWDVEAVWLRPGRIGVSCAAVRDVNTPLLTHLRDAETVIAQSERFLLPRWRGLTPYSPVHVRVFGPNFGCY